LIKTTSRDKFPATARRSATEFPVI
jgi:hypothetical protein